jgi:hypothetical protein
MDAAASAAPDDALSASADSRSPEGRTSPAIRACCAGSKTSTRRNELRFEQNRLAQRQNELAERANRAAAQANDFAARVDDINRRIEVHLHDIGAQLVRQGMATEEAR